MTTDPIPDSAVEAAFGAFLDSFCDDEAGQVEHVAALDGSTGWAMAGGNDARAVFDKALTAAAPLIVAQAVGSDHWAHAAIAAQDAALTAQINEDVKWGREKDAELTDLRAGIEALRNEWRAGLCACLTCTETRRHADALDALLREGE